MSATKITFIGAGRMAEALIRGLLAKGLLRPEEIVAADTDAARRRFIARQYSVRTCGDNAEAVEGADYILLAVKPQNLQAAATGFKSALNRRKTLISIVAGVPAAHIRNLIGVDLPIVRVMPNAPALVNQGISAVTLPEGLEADKADFVDRILQSVGDVIQVDESDIDAVTAVSGSGPAYFFLLVRELALAGKALGLSHRTALTLARRTFVGAAMLLDAAGLSEDDLIKSVASPGGTTEAALKTFDERGLSDVIAGAVSAAASRAAELAKLALSSPISGED